MPQVLLQFLIVSSPIVEQFFFFCYTPAMTAEAGRLFNRVDSAQVPEGQRIPTRWVVIAGGPSSGKSTIFERLQQHLPGYTFIPEITRSFVLSDIAAGNMPNMTPEYNDGLNRRVTAARKTIEGSLDPATPALMDRGTFDTRAYARYYGVDEEYITSNKEYNAVFIMEPLAYAIDGVRYDGDDPHFVATFDKVLFDMYAEHGYQPIRVSQFPYGEPASQNAQERTEISIEQRARFILEKLGIPYEKQVN